MTPLEAANRLIEIKTTADVHSDSIQWSSEDVAYFNDLCIDHATGIAEALIAAMAENARLRDEAIAALDGSPEIARAVDAITRLGNL